MLCVWVYLPRAQPVLLAVCTWHFPDPGAANDATTSGDDDKDYQHLDIQLRRMQVVLCSEPRQLVIQMFLGLLHGMRGMCINDTVDKHRLNIGNINVYYSHNYFLVSTAARVQDLVRRQ